MSTWFKRLFNRKPKTESKAPEFELNIPTFFLPESAQRYIDLFQENKEKEREDVTNKLLPLIENMEALLQGDMDSITRELNERKARILLKQANELKLRASLLQKIAGIITRNQVQLEEGMKIRAEGVVLGRTTKPRWEVCQEERVIMQYQGCIYLIGYLLEPILKETGKIIPERKEGDKTILEHPECVPTGEFEPAKMKWITNSLSQLSNKELEMLKTTGIICNNKE